MFALKHLISHFIFLFISDSLDKPVESAPQELSPSQSGIKVSDLSEEDLGGDEAGKLKHAEDLIEKVKKL